MTTIRFQADADLNQNIVTATLRRGVQESVDQRCCRYFDPYDFASSGKSSVTK